MNLLLTDRLSCSRCGPEFGLILLADRMEDRRVLDGTLGCPNCRDAYPIVDGFADLRAPPRRELASGLAGTPREPVATEVERMAALLGVVRGPGTLVLVGRPAALAAALAQRVESIHTVGVDADLGTWDDAPGVSRLVARPGLPFFSRSLRGVAVDARLGRSWIEEAARTVAPLSRVVVTDAPPEGSEWVRHAGLEVLAAEADTVVAERR